MDEEYELYRFPPLGGLLLKQNSKQSQKTKQKSNRMARCIR